MDSPDKVLLGLDGLHGQFTASNVLHCALEDNEWSFCALWTESLKIDCADVLVNERLDDHFFNRARIEGCPDSVGKVAAEFWSRGLDCYLYQLQDEAAFDKIYTLKFTGAVQDGDVRQIERKEIGQWVDLFCESFEVQWQDEVAEILGRHFDKLHLLVAYKGKHAAGCAALYLKNSAMGLYCLGTLPRFRNQGVARAIISKAAKIAKQNNSILFAQSLESENSLGFYGKTGFSVVYCKTIKRLPMFS